MRAFYPKIEPRRELRLQADGGHVVYVEEFGRPDGIPVVFLHGGPGAGCGADHRRYFDPARYRVVLFDQRGCGRSTPHGCLDANDTPALIADMERIRTELRISRWLLFGGSWGSALALAYALEHADRVLGMILRGTFLGTAAEVDWLLRDGGAARIFPDAWEAFVSSLAASGRDDPLFACRDAVAGGDAERARNAAQAWERWTGHVATHTVRSRAGEPAGNGVPAAHRPVEERDALVRRVALECHYATHGYFLREGGLLAALPALAGIPLTLVHGELDLMCPLRSSWRIHRTLPGSTLVKVPDTGHLGNEPGMIDALVSAADAFAARF